MLLSFCFIVFLLYFIGEIRCIHPNIILFAKTFLNKGFNDYIIIGKREIIPDVEDNFL